MPSPVVVDSCNGTIGSAILKIKTNHDILVWQVYTARSNFDNLGGLMFARKLRNRLTLALFRRVHDPQFFAVTLAEMSKNSGFRQGTTVTAYFRETATRAGFIGIHTGQHGIVYVGVSPNGKTVTYRTSKKLTPSYKLSRKFTERDLRFMLQACEFASFVREFLDFEFEIVDFDGQLRGPRMVDLQRPFASA